jgi:exodeoxyribonuclease VII small subunit
MVVKKKEVSFEEALKRLEEISIKMGDSGLSLEDSIKMFQQGMELSSVCNKKLEEAEKKINIVLNNQEGKLVEGDFDSVEE